MAIPHVGLKAPPESLINIKLFIVVIVFIDSLEVSQKFTCLSPGLLENLWGFSQYYIYFSLGDTCSCTRYTVIQWKA